ncbi:sesquipedalian-1 [Drosophila grimshawi]|uniref:GH10795 n=1 Tax=Drosophila grimshawi TaxID=7222 RepID=B4JB80_DROGR|nr:sesquipedalian-1 [Drosophila grimshawi]EDW02885.1 GH10795 [Drosophila grimshawi]
MKINEKNLCVFARSPPFDMEGFLNKRGVVNKSFQRRYFVLKGNLLFYFETRLDKEPLGLIVVEGCTIELSLESDVDNYCFEIAFNGNRTYILAADTHDSMEAWMKALTCAGYEYKRIIVAELQRQLQEIEDSRNKMRTDPTDALVDKPRPPPRRQNPFNRPAPPPPDCAPGLRNGVIMSPMPFVAGYFGSSNAKAQLQQERSYSGNNNTSPQTTPKMQRRPQQPQPQSQPQPQPGAAHAIFYSDTPIAATRVLAISNNNNSNDKKKRPNASEEFKINHELHRKIIMTDIEAYRQGQKQPLIQF